MIPRALNAAVLLLSALPVTAAVWTPLGPPAQTGVADAPRIHAVALSPAYLFAAADEGVYRSPDRGTSWEVFGPDPNESRGVISVAFDPRDPFTVYAGAYAGLYKSVDAGTTWSLIFTEQSVYTVVLDPVSPNVIYAGGALDLSPARLYRSVDAGRTWQLLASTSDYYPFTAIAVSSLDPDTIYAGTHRGELYKSTDHGVVWSLLSGPFDGRITSIVLDPAQPETVYVSSTATVVPMGPPPGSILRSRDGGASWTELSGVPPLWVGALAMDPTSSAHLVATAEGNAYETVDAGDTWTPLSAGSPPLYADAIVFDPQRAGTIYLASGSVYRADLSASPCGVTALCAQNGRFEVTVEWQGTPLGPSIPAAAVPVTDDSGYFWFFAPENVEIMVKVLDGRPVNGAYWVFSGALSNLAYHVTVRDTLTSAVWTHDNPWGAMASVADTNAFPAAGGVASAMPRTVAAAASWTPIGPAGPNPPAVYSLAADPRSPSVVYALHADSFESALSRSVDAGATWTTLLHSDSARVVVVDPTMPDRVYLGTAGGVQVSLDDGGTWTGPAGPETYSLAAANGAIYAGTWSAVAVSRDGGRSWMSLSIPVSNGYSDPVSAVAVSPSGRLFAGTTNGNLWRSDDDGTTWTLAWSDADHGFTAIIVDPFEPSVIHAGTTPTGPAPLHVPVPSEYLRSADGGETWTESFLPGVRGSVGGFDALIADRATSGVLYAGSDGGVYRSVDRGTTWSPIGPIGRVWALALSGSALYAGTFDGAFSADVSALPAPCSTDPATLCLNDSRFRVRASFQTGSDGPTVEAQPIALTRDAGAFWFFEPANIELVVKLLDGRPVNGKFWVFVGGLSSVQYTIEVTDTETGGVWTHDHAPGDVESFADTAAF